MARDAAPLCWPWWGKDTVQEGSATLLGLPQQPQDCDSCPGVISHEMLIGAKQW